MNEYFDGLRFKEVFSTLDANSGHPADLIERTDINKMALLTTCSLYRHTRMPFELKTASAPFHSAIGIILATLKWQRLFANLDDIDVFSKHPGKNLFYFKSFLQWIKTASKKMTVNEDCFPPAQWTVLVM